MSDESLSERKQRLLLNLDIISLINDALMRLEYNTDGQRLDLERIHGSITVEIVKGQFQRLQITESRLLTNKQRQQKTA